VYQISGESSRDISSNKSGEDHATGWNISEETVVIPDTWSDNQSHASESNTGTQHTSKKSYHDVRLWVVHILLPNFIKFLEGILCVVVTFVIIIQSSNIIDLFKDFAAMQVITKLDNVGFWLANHGKFFIAMGKYFFIVNTML